MAGNSDGAGRLRWEEREEARLSALAYVAGSAIPLLSLAVLSVAYCRLKVNQPAFF